MIEIPISHRQIEKIEVPGKFGNETKQTFLNREKLNKVVYRSSTAKTFEGYMKGSIKVAQMQKSKELEILLESILSKYLELEGKNESILC